jgi:Serine incorporator (Serinc)
MWMRIVSSWISVILYSWSLLAPIVMPDRYVFLSIYMPLLIICVVSEIGIDSACPRPLCIH